MSEENLNLWTVNVGSHMWKMETEESDRDLTSAFLMSGDKFLIGTNSNCHFTQDKEKKIDHQRYEIGKVIQQIKKMNVNYVWTIMSPIILCQHRNWLQQLRQLVMENPSKQIYYSIQGMARNNIKRFLTEEVDKYVEFDPQYSGYNEVLTIKKPKLSPKKYNKKVNTIGRTIQFGINYLLYGKFIYEKTNIKTKNELDELMIRLQQAFDQSSYPKHPNHKPFDNYLKKIRLYSLKLSKYI